MQHRRDELAEARPEALLGTRRRFLTLAGAAAVLAFSTRLPGAESARARSLASYPFTLGVASGDPLPDSVVLWTRLAPVALDPFGGMPYAPVDVTWELADDEGFARVVQRGTAVARPEFAHSVHVDVKGLEPGREYFYRFVAAGERSATGRTRTAPATGNGALRFAFVSCQNWEAGYYTPYQHLVDEDVDVVLHLGDYIYEGVHDQSATRPGRSRRTARPIIDSLDQYRLRHALYKTDPDLQAAHAAAAVRRRPGTTTRSSTTTRTRRRPRATRQADVPRPPRQRLPARTGRTCRCGSPQQPQGPDMQLYRRFRYGDLRRVQRARHAPVPQRAGHRQRPLRPARARSSGPSRSSGCSTASAPRRRAGTCSPSRC